MAKLEGEINTLKDYTTLLRDTFQACHLHQVRYLTIIGLASFPDPLPSFSRLYMYMYMCAESAYKYIR